jgi:gluconate kinase
MKIILLTGIPGTGKTKIGNHLKDKYGFYHIDLEDPGINSSPEFAQYSQINLNPDVLMNQIKDSGKNVVITWGFYPAVHDPLLLRLQKLGAKIFWLDGDRDLAKEAWKNRDNPIPEKLFDDQIQRIDSHDIQNIFHPINFDAFDSKTMKHKPIDKIVNELLGKLENTATNNSQLN